MHRIARWAWQYVKLSPISIIVYAIVIVILSIRDDWLGDVGYFAAIVLPLLSVIALLVASIKGRMLGKAKWLPLLQLIELPVVALSFGAFYIPRSHMEDTGLGIGITVIVSCGLMVANFTMGYILAFYLQSRYDEGRPVSSWYLLLIPLIAGLVVIANTIG